MREARRAGNFISSRFGVQASVVPTNAREPAGTRHGGDGFLTDLIYTSPTGLA